MCSSRVVKKFGHYSSVSMGRTGSISTSANASGDETIWPSRHDMAGSGRAAANNGTSAVDDRARRGGLGYTGGALNAQSAM